MKNYVLFEEMDFIVDEDFIRWVRCKLPEDEDFWQSWLGQHPGKHLMIANARRAVEAIAIRQAVLSQSALKASVKDILEAVAQPVPHGISHWRSWPWLRIAAIFLLVCSAVYTASMMHGDGETRYSYRHLATSPAMVEKVNNTAAMIPVHLPDGSLVELSPGSRISYTPHLQTHATRDIYLDGEAFFSVTRNPSRPFRVFTGEIVTKVLGTSFTVRSFDADRSIVVKVRTGQVSVASQKMVSPKESSAPNSLTGIILSPNQQVFYEKSGKTFKKELVSKPLVIAARFDKREMIFEDRPVVQVLELIKSVYGVSISYDAEALKNCTLTADLTNELLYRKLDLLCAAIEATYEIIDGQVFIEASPCR